MSQTVSRIRRSINNGPFVYDVSIDGVLQTDVTGVATLGAALDAVKAALGAVPGTVQTVVITMNNT